MIEYSFRTEVTLKTTKKSKKLSPVLLPSPESTPNPSLPDDLLVSCFARVSRLYHPTLSLVSKSFGSLLASPELYQTRSSLGITESCLYVCLQFPPEPNSRWFTLCLKPNRNLTNDTKNKKYKSCGYALATLPIPHSPPAHWSGVVAFGSNIYNIGGCDHKAYSSSVSVLDCKSNTWRKGPKMHVERNYPSATVFDGKIYVAGGCKDCDNSNWMEIYDPETQAWEVVLSDGAEICGCRIGKTAGIDGKVYMFGQINGLAYKTKQGTWNRVEWQMDMGWPWFSYGVIANVLYYYSDRKFKWYDTMERQWREVKGLEGLPKFASYGCVKLADYGGKMAVLWDKYLPSSGYKKKTIWCAVIALEKRNDEEIWGDVESLMISFVLLPLLFDYIVYFRMMHVLV